MPCLSSLPNELLSLVASHLDHPKDVLHLSMSSRRLYEFTKLDGWKALLKGRFGLTGLDPDARNAVHGLTTLYRNWDRKAFIARFTEPPPRTRSLQTWETKRWRGPQGQTMGYQSHIDSYEEILGGWADRREVLVWSAGTHVVMRVKETGSKAREILGNYQHFDMNENDSRRLPPFDNHRNVMSWYTYKIPESWEGRDDITTLKLLQPHQKNGAYDSFAYGSASGHLSIVSVDPKQQELREQSYSTGRQSVNSLSISPCANPLISAALSDNILALFSMDLVEQSEKPIDALSLISPIARGGRNGRLWSNNFISNDKVAIGLGPSYEPIQVFEITPTGFSSDPLRKFGFDAKLDVPMKNSTSVYPILPVSTGPEGYSESGNVFLSGGYDGIIRLHDMRSPHGFETMFLDVTNASSIYSLATQGLERVVAGTSTFSMLKVFDLRFAGSHAYHSAPLPPRSKVRRLSKGLDDVQHSSPISGGWNLFLSPRNQVRHNNMRSPYSRPPRTDYSPIYSLSIPSSTSPSLYAGLEGTVVNLDFVSILDKYPDPLFNQTIERFPDSGEVHLEQSYNPNSDVLNLGMYEQGDDKMLGMHLMVQDSIGMGVVENAQARDSARFMGLDERWKDPSDESNRWIRGQDPRSRRGALHRGRRRGRERH
ncbi:hypothetical protein CC78DRAFT_622046 [Lojkania enalia]|uniref:F-box domain-containing protein n=1 Tax=Lojkania enalia TaxID=147567 RepID=A0A9P4JWZ9_9PLEO|nr:hypothetical protein CC78DRAFT_622046 [Didymosphaeria enalia]